MAKDARLTIPPRAGAGLLAALWLGACAAPVLLPPARQLEPVFDRTTPLSANLEIARRTLTPLTARRVADLEARRGGLRAQAIDLAKEKFALYVPAGPAPKAGYGLLVFIPPWPGPTRPTRWRRPLDRHGLIFVSAENSGNETKILDRRLPLALLAWENVRARYPIDPARVYVGGFSGGSRAAETAALAFPDVFRGALLEAGSDPIDGTQGLYLPPAELFRRFQRSRIVFVTGERDELNLRDDARTRDSLEDACVFDVAVVAARGLAHEPLDRDSLERALEALDRRDPPDEARQARCEARVQRELAARLAQVEAAIARGDRDGARSQLKALDARYAGLAAPALLDLDARLAALR